MELEAGVLYRWDEYKPVTKVGPFDEIQDLLLHRSIEVVEDPTIGWLISLPQWDYFLYPAVGAEMMIALDDEVVSFDVKDVETLVVYSYSDSNLGLRKEEKLEVKRAAVPVGSGAAQLSRWLDRHHGLDASRRAHQRNLDNPRFLNKNKPVRFFEFMVGKPDERQYALKPGLGVPLLP
jgi:hypothetical protein